MLVEALRRRLRDPGAHSFQLMGEDLALVAGEDLARAADEWRAALERVPEPLRRRFLDAQVESQTEAHALLRRFNRSVQQRIAGYVELGRRCEFLYPWPVVAILGIEQVLIGMRNNRVYGLMGELLQRLGWDALAALSDGSEDVLRRTNRGIFADSIPTVSYAMRVIWRVRHNEAELAQALTDGPLPPTLDEECRVLVRELVAGLVEPSPARRFRRLAELTRRHFAREQAIFTFHMGASESGPPTRTPRSPIMRRLLKLRSVPAPAIVRVGGQRAVRLVDVALPPGFDMRDHAARVEAFGRAFVDSVTGDVEDYRAAVAHVLARWGRPGEAATAATLPL